ncbi:antiviral reverse transcriptase Drt3a [Desulfovibrio desulfuricans]|nr:antiviral reverse transcriptase Drt3a [Desulfovibrio desulfuricans]
MPLFRQTFEASTLRKFIRRSDFWKKNNFCDDRSELDCVLSQLCERIWDIHYKIETKFFTNQNQKRVYVINDYDDSIVLRKIASDIKRIYQLFPPSRNEIVEQVISLLKDGSSYSILRTDIKSFFESIPLEKIISKLSDDGLLSPKSLSIIKNLYRNEDGTTSFKRGFSTSSILSELYMRSFDRKIKEIDGVYYYNRFVDDIVIFTTKDTKHLLTIIATLLGENLKLNEKKTSITILPCEKYQTKGYYKHKKCNESEQCKYNNKSFNYLGYNFTIPCLPNKDTKEREIEVRLSKNKLNKYKTRITKSFLKYAKDRNFDLLIDRISFLTDNSKIPSERNIGKIMTGIYYTYPFLSNPDNELCELDKYLLNCIHCSHNAFNGQIRFTREQLKAIKKYTFVNGFKKQISHSVTYVKLAQICECWKHA